jgi:heterotetrameric sarcosine oxidase delta subunit
MDEFVQLGAAGLDRPAADADLQSFVDFVYFRDNPAGLHEELFQHAGGCRTMLTVRRDTRTHQIASVHSHAISS